MNVDEKLVLILDFTKFLRRWFFLHGILSFVLPAFWVLPLSISIPFVVTFGFCLSFWSSRHIQDFVTKIEKR